MTCSPGPTCFTSKSFDFYNTFWKTSSIMILTSSYELLSAFFHFPEDAEWNDWQFDFLLAPVIHDLLE